MLNIVWLDEAPCQTITAQATTSKPSCQTVCTHKLVYIHCISQCQHLSPLLPMQLVPSSTDNAASSLPSTDIVASFLSSTHNAANSLSSTDNAASSISSTDNAASSISSTDNAASSLSSTDCAGQVALYTLAAIHDVICELDKTHHC